MEHVPLLVGVAFALTTGFAVWAFVRAARYSRLTLVVLVAWLAVQAALGRSGFYLQSEAMPPRLALALAPPALGIAALFLTRAGRAYVDGLHLGTLTGLHVVRIPVELVLLALYRYGAVPRLMTFEGRNWDIAAGVSALLVCLAASRAKSFEPRWLLAWNLVGLGLLLHVVVLAVFAVPSPIQRWAFDQPNVAVLHVPFVWLPSCVVPLVLLAHLTAIRRLTRPGRAPAFTLR